MMGGSHVPPWVWSSRQAGGGVLMYSGIHSIDWQSWIVGAPVQEVYARSLAASGDTDAEDGVVATWSFANGVQGTLIGNQPDYLVTPRTREFELYGDRGRIRIRNGAFLEFTSEEKSYRVDVDRDDPFLTQAREFMADVREDREPWITGEDGLRALAVILAIYRSADLGQPVEVADIA
jgi:predicted dehydrogenase